MAALRFLLFTALCWAGLLASGTSLETTRVTPYNAPRTRIASSRGFAGINGELHSTPFDRSATATHVATKSVALQSNDLPAHSKHQQ
jgi:hypothetical protein